MCQYVSYGFPAQVVKVTLWRKEILVSDWLAGVKITQNIRTPQTPVPDHVLVVPVDTVAVGIYAQ